MRDLSDFQNVASVWEECGVPEVDNNEGKRRGGEGRGNTSTSHFNDRKEAEACSLKEEFLGARGVLQMY